METKYTPRNPKYTPTEIEIMREDAIRLVGSYLGNEKLSQFQVMTLAESYLQTYLLADTNHYDLSKYVAGKIKG